MPSERAFVSPGRSYRTQWLKVPTGASGSSIIRVKLFAAVGAPSHESGGERSAPSQVYGLGMVPPSLKAVLFIVKTITSPPFCAETSAPADENNPPFSPFRKGGEGGFDRGLSSEPKV